MLRALGLLLADVPPQWRGGRLFGALENDHNSIPRCETNRLSEGHKRAVDKIWGRTAKTDLGPKSFRAQKIEHFLRGAMVWPRPGKVVQNRVTFSRINIKLLANFGCFLGKKLGFWPKKNVFRQNVKMAVSP